MLFTCKLRHFVRFVNSEKQFILVNAGKVISNCICFGENIVTIGYQTPVFVNKIRQNSLSCKPNSLLNACLKKGRKLVLSWKFENSSVGRKVLQNFVNSFCLFAFFKCIRNCNGIEFLPRVWLEIILYFNWKFNYITRGDFSCVYARLVICVKSN